MLTEIPFQSNEKNKVNWEEIKYFLISSTIGTIFFYLLYQLIYYITEDLPYQETFSWIFSYSISICWQHYLNRKLVFKIGSPVNFIA